jgi:glycosyltransferase involved in cell wall biosynthesis/SAM-dependent methyltransferase
MRIAFFSPLPPEKSGIADYSAALLATLSHRAQVDAFSTRPAGFQPGNYDVCLYQIGNNPHHAAAYEMALATPGVVVVHEANLHHLIADLTIRRGDWDAYLREVEFDGGAPALEYARKHVRTLERGPDYDSLPMLRRLLQASKAAIVHSKAVEGAARAAGFRGPVARIWHGAWIVEPDRMAGRERLGLDETTPLIGIFGFLKPYKRIAESLRAFRRLVRLEPRAKMILVGETHPELPVESLIDSLALQDSVRVLGFAPIEDFNRYLGACDIVLNLRYPTVGESSGTLQRALGMGKAVIVSDVGSFREYPDEICLKAPVDASEEDCLFEYLNLLVSRPEFARRIGAAARTWVQSECTWEIIAEKYVDFLSCVIAGTAPLSQPVMEHRPEQVIAAAAAPDGRDSAPLGDEVRSWAVHQDSKAYVEAHGARLSKTLEVTPRGTAEDRVLEMGAYFHITPALRTRLGYGEVRACHYGAAGQQEHRTVTSESGEQFECVVDLFDAERDPFPYDGGHFSTVLCCELIEHLFEDPMHMMAEINRVLRAGGSLVLTTPNIVSLRAVAAVVETRHPGFFPSYLRPRPGGDTDRRHSREYTPLEISNLLVNSGFEVTLLETGPFREEARPEQAWVLHLLERYMGATDLRGDCIYAVGRKSGAVRERYPGWLYS